jgi:Flp pilus assembly protein CpaB
MTRWAVLISVVFGLAAAWLVFDYGQSLKREEAGVAYLQLKPSVDVASNSPVPAEALGSVVLPEAYADMSGFAIPDNLQNRTWLAGRDATRDIAGGSLLLYEHFSEAPTETFSGGISPGYRAMSLSVGPDTAVSFFIQPGSRVDIIGAFKTVEYRNIDMPDHLKNNPNIDPTEASTPVPMESYVARTLAQNVRVLAVGGADSQRGYQQISDGGYGTITVEVTPRQAEELVFAMPQLEGKLSAVLRNPADGEIVDIPQVYWDDLGASR